MKTKTLNECIDNFAKCIHCQVSKRSKNKCFRSTGHNWYVPVHDLMMCKEIIQKNQQDQGGEEMSIVYCHYCDEHIDTDFNAEHFITNKYPEGNESYCIEQEDEEGDENK